jgi:exosortase
MNALRPIAAALDRDKLFGAYCVCVALVSAPAFRALFALSVRDPTASHLLLVPLVSVALIWLDRQMIFASTRLTASSGLIVILMGSGLALLGQFHTPTGGLANELAPAIAAVVLLWIGGFIFFYGWTAFRRGIFPLLFLGFMIPIPDRVLDAVVFTLKTGSAETVAALLTLSGTLFNRNGFVFAFPKLTIEIADECSGIRSSLALLLTSLLIGHLYLKSRWSKTVLALAILPIAVLKNGIRIASLCLFSTHVDPDVFSGRLHREGGILFFLLALAMLAPLLYLLRRAETARTQRATRDYRSGAASANEPV